MNHSPTALNNTHALLSPPPATPSLPGGERGAEVNDEGGEEEEEESTERRGGPGNMKQISLIRIFHHTNVFIHADFTLIC